MQFHSMIFASATIFMQLARGLPAIDVRFNTPCRTPNNEPAYCTEIHKCPILYKQVLDRNIESYDFLRASDCGPANQDLRFPKVCCGSYGNYINNKTATTTMATTTPPPPPRLPSPAKKNCGVQEVTLPNRIFGGTDAELGEFPWMARLKHINDFNFSSFGCSGFLIHRRFVVTAAHCIQAQALKPLGPLEEVVFGSHSDPEPCVNYSDGQKECNQPLTVKIDKVLVHRNYEPLQHLHDIALIRLSQKVDETKYIKPICLSYNATDRRELWLSGWGRTEKGATSSIKQKVSVPRVDASTCVEKYRTVNMNIQNTQICAGGIQGRDSCTGDSGGPLMVEDENHVWYAEGIVSYGTGCGRLNWPGVYTHLPKYVNWISESISSFNRRRRHRNNVLLA